MANTRQTPDDESGELELRRHRARILYTLLDICRGIEHLQISPVARRACREVSRLLDVALAREIMPGGRKPESGRGEKTF